MSVCKDNDNCRMIILEAHNKVLKFTQNHRSMKFYSSYIQKWNICLKKQKIKIKIV